MKRATKVVLYISPLPPPAGGIATWTRRLIDLGLPDDYSIKVVNTYKIEKQFMGELRRSFRIFFNLVATLKREKIDIIHLNTAVADGGIAREVICVFLAHLHKKPIVLHCRCDVAEHMKSMKLIWRLFAKLLFSNVDYIINLNKVSSLYIKEAYARESEYVPNFLDEGFFKQINQIQKVSLEMKKVLFVGMIVRWKGAELVLEVARRLPDLCFDMVGRDVDVIKRAKDIPSNVILHGELSYDEVKNMMSQADLFLFPSYREGFPNAVMEAMAVGLPIVATDAGAIPDMLGEEGGIVVKQGRIEELVSAILTIKDDVQRRQRMCDYNKEKVRNHYMYDVVTRRYTAIYDGLLSTHYSKGS